MVGYALFTVHSSPRPYAEIREIRAEIVENTKEDCLAHYGIPHHVYPYGDDYPTVREFTWYEDNGETDEELDGYCESIKIPYVWREYSPTGQIFSDYAHWKRTPKGIVIIHQTSRDV